VLDLVPAGRQSPGYASKVNSFDWQTFYDRLGGGAFLQSMRDLVREDYDAVLIDSRTGVSDTAGICTVELPDDLVVCFTLNSQSIEGAAAVSGSVRGQRSAQDLLVYPVPMRVEFAEKLRLERARDNARRRFEPLLFDMSAEERDRYWGDVEVVYQPFYAYEEVLAVFGDRPHQTSSVLGAVERLTARLTRGEALALPPMEESTRREMLARYAAPSGTRVPAARGPGVPGVYVSYSRRATELARRIVGSLQSDALPYRLVVDPQVVSTGSSWETQTEQAIAESAAVVAIVTADVDRSISIVRQECELAATLGKPIVPVLADPDTPLPYSLRDRQAVALEPSESGEDFRISVARLGKAIESAVSAKGGSTPPSSHRRVTLHLDGTRVRLVAELDDVQSPHDLHHLELHAVRALTTVVYSRTPPVRKVPSPPSSTPDDDPARVLGQLLYRDVFTGRVAIVLEQLLEESAREPDRPLGLHLQLTRTPERLETLPWELLCGPPGPDSDVLARRRDVRLTLGVGGVLSPHPGPPADGELRAVVLDADVSAADSTPMVDLATSHGASVKVVDASSPAAMRDTVEVQPHVVHVVGTFEPAQWSEPERVDLSVLVQDLPFVLKRAPVLVVLEERAFGATVVRETALNLLTAGVSDVVVVSAPTRQQSMRFLTAFYEALVAGDWIDDAVDRGRRADRYSRPGAGTVVSLWTAGERRAVVARPVGQASTTRDL
jgi:hypothetical protein